MLAANQIAYHFHVGRPSWTADGLAHRLRAPLEFLEHILATLERHDMLAQTGDEPPAFLPARPLEATRLSDVLDAVRAADEAGRFMRLPPEPAVDALLEETERAAETALGGRTLKDLATAGLDAATTERVMALRETPPTTPHRARRPRARGRRSDNHRQPTFFRETTRCAGLCTRENLRLSKSRRAVGTSSTLTIALFQQCPWARGKRSATTGPRYPIDLPAAAVLTI